MQLADPSPDARQQVAIWEYFESRCAYCDRVLEKALKQGHIDHLTPASAGGRNHLSNRALACADCNEKEKRDMGWSEFLSAKSSNQATYVERRARIEEWQRRHAAPNDENGERLRELALQAAAKVNAVFDEQVATIRSVKRGTKEPRTRGYLDPTVESKGARRSDARYRFTRLCFKADVIEPLQPNEVFQVDTPEGSFRMTKQEFYLVFDNVVASRSYQEQRIYHYSKTPDKARPFLMLDHDAI